MVAAFVRVHTGAGSVLPPQRPSPLLASSWVLVQWQRTPAVSRAPCPPSGIAGSIRSGPPLRPLLSHAAGVAPALLHLHLLRPPPSGRCSPSSPARDLHQGRPRLRHPQRLTRPRRRRRGHLPAATPAVAISADRILAARQASGRAPRSSCSPSFTPPSSIIPTLIVSGFAWTSAMSTLNVSVQLARPRLGSRARALGNLPHDLPGWPRARFPSSGGSIAERTSTPVCPSPCPAPASCSPCPWCIASVSCRAPLPDLRPLRLDPSPHPSSPPAPAGTADPLEGPPSASPSTTASTPPHYTQFTRAIHELRSVRPPRWRPSAGASSAMPRIPNT